MTPVSHRRKMLFLSLSIVGLVVGSIIFSLSLYQELVLTYSSKTILPFGVTVNYSVMDSLALNDAVIMASSAPLIALSALLFLRNFRYALSAIRMK